MPEQERKQIEMQSKVHAYERGFSPLYMYLNVLHLIVYFHFRDNETEPDMLTVPKQYCGR